jgi:hypothetical protein
MRVSLVSSRLSRVGGSCFLSAFVVALSAGLVAGCGSSGSPSGSTPLSGNTSVTLLVSSTANDKLVQFSLGLTSLTLMNQSGTAVNVLTTANGAEFIHLNGTAEPLATISVPQGIYTAASAIVGGAQFGCANLDPTTGGVNNSTFSYGMTPAANVSVTLPAPITIVGDAMGLSLDLLVSKSAAFNSCDPDGGINPFSITPSFTLTPMIFSAQQTNSTNGKMDGLTGIISSAGSGGDSFNIRWADGPVSTINVNGNTILQGVSGISALAAGTLVDTDVSIQLDGTLLATRLEVEDGNATNLSAWNGPVEIVNAIIPVQTTGAREESGYLFTSTYILGGATFSFGDAAFQISGQLSNLKSLPFAATFTAANMVAGQNVNVSTHAPTLEASYPTYLAATTVTLLPQTINGTVSAISNSGGFTTYTVKLAAYDLMPAMAVQAGQTTLLTNPGTVVVYVDSNAQLLNSGPIAIGSVVRFNGLLFNDQGTLRMDCAQINDGVAE